jgi:hypothetical protein
MKLSEYINKLGRTDSFDMTNEEFYSLLFGYNSFITQPFTLSMFIPCKEVNGKWGVLEEPESWIRFKDVSSNINNLQIVECEQYQYALDNVIFKGFELYFKNDLYWIGIKDKPFVIYISDCGKEFRKVKDFKTIEDILKHIEFTDKVKKQFNIE